MIGAVYDAVRDEVTRQREQWGEDHDREHAPSDWIYLIENRVQRLKDAMYGGGDTRSEMRKIAALAVSAQRVLAPMYDFDGMAHSRRPAMPGWPLSEWLVSIEMRILDAKSAVYHGDRDKVVAEIAGIEFLAISCGVQFGM